MNISCHPHRTTYSQAENERLCRVTPKTVKSYNRAKNVKLCRVTFRERRPFVDKRKMKD